MAAMNFVRQSKFRHVFCKQIKKEFCIDDIRITKISWDSCFCAVNPKFLAVITEGSGGPFVVVPIAKVGRIGKDYPVVDAHRGPCLDIQWCPFNDNVIASCSEDCTTKVWHIPDSGLHRTVDQPLVTLAGHQKRVSSIQWHPTANNILMSAGADMKLILWNVANGEALIEVAGHPDLIWSVAFNYNGSKIVTTCKDKKIRVIDPRTGRILQQGMGHEGVKPQRAIFLKDGRIFSTGFTKRSERMYALREEQRLDEPIVQDELDSSNGVLFPFYDNDTGLVYLAGKGDSNVRYYEINNEPPFVHYINVYSTPEPQRGLAFMPKRALNVNENETARIYKCTNKGLVDVLQFFVPRKSELFQDDLYPDTAAPVAALSAEEWMEGKDADPVLMSLRGGAQADAVKQKTQVVAKKANILAEPASHPQPPQSAASMSQSQRSSLLSAGKPSEMASSYKQDRESSYANREPKSPSAREPPPPSSQSRGASRTSSYSRESAGPEEPVFAGYGSRSTRESSRASFDSTAPAASTPMVSTTVVTAMPSSFRSSSGVEINIEELFADVAKLKNVIKRHERRIRLLEESLNDKNLDFD